jgi:hypothetical protein
MNRFLRKMIWNEENSVEISFHKQLERLGWEIWHLPKGAKTHESQ